MIFHISLILLTQKGKSKGKRKERRGKGEKEERRGKNQAERRGERNVLNCRKPCENVENCSKYARFGYIVLASISESSGHRRRSEGEIHPPNILLRGDGPYNHPSPNVDAHVCIFDQINLIRAKRNMKWIWV